MRSSPARNSRRAAFTLIEVLIVVVIMAILAATIIPQFSSTSKDAEKNSLEYDLHVLRRQIEQYKVQHRGVPPELVAGGLPQLVAATNANGDIGASGTDYPFGPYVYGGKLPINPTTSSNAVTSISTFPPTTFTGGGWLYLEVTGQIAADK